ncbi:hypothetical protein [Paenibacillus sp. 481]|uniref:hypothetical protein n=1 Tax=Paenibacillus sp. 481 TaxID=2835869 RepID=UPI001E457477|nr:hypothetical protein [Paenibacillus sp. 481]UHA73813.1 hypothetical protein KIK04_01175 [Paenibacillus sp. 481]
MTKTNVPMQRRERERYHNVKATWYATYVVKHWQYSMQLDTKTGEIQYETKSF